MIPQKILKSKNINTATKAAKLLALYSSFNIYDRNRTELVTSLVELIKRIFS